jgi:hypothetical protein
MAWPEPNVWVQVFVGLGFAMALAGLSVPPPGRYVLFGLGAVFMAAAAVARGPKGK